MITWTNITVRLGDLRPWADNPRLSTKKQAENILQSFHEFGQVELIAVSPDLDVYNGHQRLSALLAIYGRDYTIEARQSSRHLTEAEKRKLTITLHAGATGSWDWDSLSGWEPMELKEWGFDDSLLTNWRLDVASLGNFLESEEEAKKSDAPPQTDRAEELRELWGVELGQLWRLESRTAGQVHYLICGDCTSAGVVDRVMMGGQAQMCATDPPYAIFGSSTGVKSDVSDANLIKPFFRELARLAQARIVPRGHCYVFCDWRTFPVISSEIGEYLEIKNCLVWSKGEKGYSGSFYSNTHELIALFVNEPRAQSMFKSYNESGTPDHRHVYSGNVFHIERVPIKEREHFAEKPADLLAIFIGKSTECGELVLEPFSGSGTTLIAAENLSRQCRAVEISPAYVAVALERYKAAFNITAELIDTI